MDHIENDDIYKGLQVNKGIEQPPSINEDAIKKFKSRARKKLSASDYTNGILAGDISLLSQAITMVESSLYEHQLIAQEIIKECLPHSGNSIRIGITGVPGVGKSTFIESLGTQITKSGYKLAVLAIDPSSEKSKGSILGDKTRMEELSANPHAYIRPSPSAGSLGGVARKTRETIILCEAAGYNVIFIETVGVGQSETAVHSMVDFFLLLMLAGAGDELQGIKRGIMEMADALAITKADGNNIQKSKLACAEYKNALHLFPATESGWIPQVLTCSALENTGMGELWNCMLDYKEFTQNNGFFEKRRSLQAIYWMHQTINEQLKEHFYQNTQIKNLLQQYEKMVVSGERSSFTAAHDLLDKYFSKE